MYAGVLPELGVSLDTYGSGKEQAAIAELPSTLLLSLPESGRKEGGGEGH